MGACKEWLFDYVQFVGFDFNCIPITTNKRFKFDSNLFTWTWDICCLARKVTGVARAFRHSTILQVETDNHIGGPINS